MNNKKMRLTESELKQVVEASVRQILMKEGFFKKAGDAIDRFENWADEKMEDFERGYDRGDRGLGSCRHSGSAG